jgi:GT2 family glycosyltransferase
METLISSCERIEKCSEIIIVDNASTDNCLQVFEEYSKKIRRPLIKIIRLKRNAGFCYAVNVGIALARSQLVAILNPDLYVDSNWLIPILRVFETLPRAGIVQPQIYWYQYPERVQSLGLYADIIGNYKDNKFGSKVILAPFGAAYVVRRDVFMKIGSLDPIYFMYGDELDLGLRMWLSGWMVVLEPRSRVYHYMGGITPPSAYFSNLKYFLMRRNQIITLAKLLSLKYLLIILPLLFVVNILRGIQSRQELRSILAAYMNIARNIRYITIKRYQYLKVKVLSESKLHRWGLFRPLI